MKEITLSTKIMIAIFSFLVIGVVLIGILSGLDDTNNNVENKNIQEQPF